MKVLISLVAVFIIGLLILMGLAGMGGAFELLIAGIILIFLVAVGNLYFSHSSSGSSKGEQMD